MPCFLRGDVNHCLCKSEIIPIQQCKSEVQGCVYQTDYYPVSNCMGGQLLNFPFFPPTLIH